MRLACVTGRLGSGGGGVSAALGPLVCALRSRGVDAELFGILDRSAPKERAGGHAFSPQAFGFVPSLRRLLIDAEPDIAHLHGLWLYTSIAVRSWSEASRRPRVISPHGMLHPWSLARSQLKKRVAALFYERSNLVGAACIHATAPEEARYVRAFGLRNPIAIVPIGVVLPPVKLRGRPPTCRRRVLFLSRFHPVKGIDHLLKAWACVAARFADWELVIAGPDENDYRMKMQRLARNLGLSDLVWLGAVQGDQKSALYNSADLFVLPTHTENFGLVVAEALAHAVPVITTHNAPWHGLEQYNCGWWIALSDDALASALEDAMSRPDTELQAMGTRGRAWVERDFAWPVIADQMCEVYTWVLGGGPPPACVNTY